MALNSLILSLDAGVRSVLEQMVTQESEIIMAVTTRGLISPTRKSHQSALRFDPASNAHSARSMESLVNRFRPRFIDTLMHPI